jgi:DnaK suppressor protein
MDALQQQQMSHASRAAYRKRLVAVEQALRSLDEGNYGWCEQCGELIDSRRLEVKPESALCIGCQQLIETGET